MQRAFVCILTLSSLVYPLRAELVAVAAEASSAASPLVGAAKVIDGSPSTFWSSVPRDTAGEDEWITIEFAATGMLAGVRLTPRFFDGNATAFPRDYHIEYSYDADGSRWFPVPGATYADVSVPGGPVTHWFAGQVPARRIRVTATDLRQDILGKFVAQVAEVEALAGENAPPFAIEGDADLADQLNVMWAIYGSVSDGSAAVYTFGSEPAYHEWMAVKYAWSSTTTALLGTLQNERILTWPLSNDGYVWSWTNQEPWPGTPPAYHNENNAKYILGAWRAWTWQRDDAWFDAVDTDTIANPALPPRPGMSDISGGMTLRAKLRLAMAYLEQELQGDLGGITIEDNGMDNTGTIDGDPTNYWDNWKFGYKNAYDNIYYYAALEAMAQLEESWGDPNRAAQLRSYRAGCHADYHDTFWSAAKGRYICTIDKDGTAWDFGATFLNLEALTYGLGDAAAATEIFEWLDGDRVIAGETSTGGDIYHWSFAPRSNTIAVESIGPPYWWADGDGAIDLDTNARWPVHLENGGAIFYVSFYDLIARLRYQGPDAALARLQQIVAEFEVDQLRRDPTAPGGGPWQLGIIGEFPESGLVPCALVYGFAGLHPAGIGLWIVPHLPATWSALTVRDVAWAGARLDVTVTPMNVTVHSQPEGASTIYKHHVPIEPGATFTFTCDERHPVLLQTAPPAGVAPVDTDGDGDVDMADLAGMQRHFASCGTWSRAGSCPDADGNGVVDWTDFRAAAALLLGPLAP